jgi:hypothetical protein
MSKRTALEQLEEVLAQRPPVHRPGTERDPRRWSEEGVRESDRTCYGISKPFARELFGRLTVGMQTLETGSGVSTLVFALGGSRHTAVSPDLEEHAALRVHAGSLGIDMTTVDFVAEPSDRYLPTCDLERLDVVLLDGKHAFPWPIIDWFYTADRLKVGGLMMLDDTRLRPVRVLVDFLKADVDRWRFEGKPGGRTSIFRKLAHPVHDATWKMHPWTVRWHAEPLWRRLIGRMVGTRRLQMPS